MKNFEEFTKRIAKLKSKSLDKSKDVLKERQSLEKRVWWRKISNKNG